MRKFFKSKLFLALCIIAVALVIFPSVFSAMGVGGAVKNAVNTVLTPFQKLFMNITDSLGGYADYVTEFDRIVEENKELKLENEKLRSRISSAEETEIMNDWLFNYIDLRQSHPDYSFCEASITGRESSNYMTVFTLNRGTAQGIKVNMPVVTETGVVGFVSEVGLDWCKVITILESGSSIGAYIERSGEIGVVEGDYTLSKDGLCSMKYLTDGADIKEGDKVLTSGYGSVYPRGLVIGYIESITDNSSSRKVDVTVKPNADLTDITRLMIITDYEKYSEEK